MNEYINNSRYFLFALTLLLSAGAAADLKLNGLATHTNHGKDQFIAAIYCESPTTEARELLLSSGDKVMEIRVVADQLYSRRFKRMWIESMAINSGSVELETHAQDMADFANFLKVKLRVGDILRIEKSNDIGIRVLIDGHELGVISNPKFFDLLLRTWIGPVPLSTSFKNQLLAGGVIDEDLRRLFYATMPIPERIMAVSSALSKVSEAVATDTTQQGPDAAQPTTIQPITTQPITTQPITAEPVAPDSATAGTEQPVATAENTSVATDATTRSEAPPPLNTTAVSTATSTTPTSSAAPATSTTQAPSTPATVASVNKGLLSEDDLFADDSILDDDDEGAITAETLLSEQLYISKLTRWTSGFVTYPKTALRNNREGTVRLTVEINREGEVMALDYAEEAEFKVLNKAAYKAVKKASPYPAMPPTLAGDTFTFTVPVVFRLE